MNTTPKAGAINRLISLARLHFTQAVDGILGVPPAKKPEPESPVRRSSLNLGGKCLIAG